MDSEETEQSPCFSGRIIKAQNRHILVLVILVQRPFGGRIRKVCSGRTIDIRVQDSRIADTQRPRREACVGTLHGEDSPCNDGVCRLWDISERRDLGKQVFKVSSDARVLVGPDESDVGVCVDARELGGEVCDNRTANPRVSHGNIYMSG